MWICKLIEMMQLCDLYIQKVTSGTAVKLFLCDHEVMGSSPKNNLLQKCREELCK
jgi:hypothetical protein